MWIKEHEESCVNHLGKPYTQVHKFLDQFFWKYGEYHRVILHHKKGVEKVVKKYGEECREPALLHIRDDTQGFIPDDWNWYSVPILLHLEDYDLLSDLLTLYYGDEQSIKAYVSRFTRK